MKKFTTLLLAILLVLPAMATISGGTKLYFDVEKINQGNERYAAYFFGDGETWVSMTQTLGSIYEVTSPAEKNYTNVIFCRMDGSNPTNDWSAKWDQTGDLTYDGTKNLFTASGKDGSTIQGSWSVYEPVVDGLKDITVYLKMNNVSATNIYYWGDKQNVWPGDEMEVTTVEGIDYYSYTFEDVRSVNIIFNNNEGQTVDIPNVTEDSYYTLLNEKEGDKYKVQEGVPEKLAENITYNNSYLLNVAGDGFDWRADNAQFGAWFYNNNLGYNNGILVEGYTFVEKETGNKVETVKLFYLDEHHVKDYLGRDIQFTGVVFLRLPDDYDFKVSDYVTFPEVWNQVATDDCPGPQSYFELTGMEAGEWKTIPTALDRVELAGGIGYAYGVVSAEGAIEVYNVNGAVVARGNDNVDLRGLGRGVYIIRNGNQVRKVVR